MIPRFLYAWAAPFSRSYGSYLATRGARIRDVRMGAHWHAGTPALAREAMVSCSPRRPREVALTFDDGPSPGVTERVLELLRERQMRATFFMIGKKAHAAGELARRVVAEGHQIGNHTLSHPHCSRLSDNKFLAEVRKAQQLLAGMAGKTPGWFRPPYGELRRSQERWVAGEGLRTAYWTVNPRDWEQPGAREIARRTLAQLHRGAVLLLHDVERQTVEALPWILDGVAARGWRSVTLAELFPRDQSGKRRP